MATADGGPLEWPARRPWLSSLGAAESSSYATLYRREGRGGRRTEEARIERNRLVLERVTGSGSTADE